MQDTASPAPAQPVPAAEPEALWVADGSGGLRAFDGRTDQASARVDIGASAHPAMVAPSLLSGDGLLWAYGEDGGVELIDPVQARVVTRASITRVTPLTDNRPYFAHGALWVAQPGRLWRVDRAGAVSSIQLPGEVKPQAVAATGRWLWLASGRRLVRVNPSTQAVTVTDELPVAAGVGQLLGTPGGLLAVGWNQSEIWVLDPETGALNSSIPVSGGELVGSLYDAGGQVWATGNCGNALRVGEAGHPRIDKVRVSNVSQGLPAGVAAGSFWVADEVRSELVRIDLRTAGVVARMPVAAADRDDPAFAVVAGRSSVWLVDLAGGILRVDPATNRVLRLGGPPTGVPDRISAVVAVPPRNQQG